MRISSMPFLCAGRAVEASNLFGSDCRGTVVEILKFEEAFFSCWRDVFGANDRFVGEMGFLVGSSFICNKSRLVRFLNQEMSFLRNGFHFSALVLGQRVLTICFAQMNSAGCPPYVSRLLSSPLPSPSNLCETRHLPCYTNTRTCCYVVFYRPCNPDVLEYLPTLTKNALLYDGSEDSDDDGCGDTSDFNAEDAEACVRSVDNVEPRLSPASSVPAGRVRHGDDARSFPTVPGAPAEVDTAKDVRRSRKGRRGVHRDDEGIAEVSSARHGTFGDTHTSNGRGDISNGTNHSPRSKRHGDPFSTTSSTSARSASAHKRRAPGSGRGNSSGGSGSGSRTGGIFRRGRLGHGTALVSPTARESGGGAGVGGLVGKSSGAGGGASGSIEPTDLDFAIRQVIHEPCNRDGSDSEVGLVRIGKRWSLR